MKSEVEQLRAMFDRYLLRWKRAVRLHQAARDREEEIALHSKYECVGGPLDGQRIWYRPPLSKYVGRGMYDLGPDRRLHYEELAANWFDKADQEC